MSSRVVAWWPAALLLLAAAGCAYMVRITVMSGTYTDFEMLYRSAVALRAGSDIYTQGNPLIDGNLNPPHVAVTMLPLAWLSLEHAAIVGWLVIAMCAAGTVWLLGRALSPWWVMCAAAMALASPAGYLSVRLINLSWPIALGVTGAWVAMRAGRHARAGAILGCLATIKVFLILFVPYLAWRRQWRALIGGIAAGSLTVAIGILVCGTDAYVEWVGQMRAIRWHANSLNVSLYGLLQRSLDPQARGGFATAYDAPSLVAPLWLVTSGVLIATAASRFARAPNLDREWAGVLIAALLISPLGWSYYWALVVGPTAATLSAQRRSWHESVGLVLSLMPFLLLTYGQPSAWLTPTWASAYTWGALLLWSAVVLTPATSARDARP